MDRFSTQSEYALENTASSPFIQFATVAEPVGRTTRRLEKAAIPGNYFANLRVNNADPALLKTELVKLGNLGDVGLEVLSTQASNQAIPVLILADLAAALDKLA